MKRQTFKGVIASASCLLSMQALLPAIAQTTMLMGSATHNTAAAKTITSNTASSVRLSAPQKPRYDYRPAVQPAPRTVYQTRTVYVKDNRTYFQRHPKVKAATIGAGVGAGAGALTGLVTGRGVLRG
ncbi:MAG TPA: hypothetical protein PKZ32_05125, partial [Candidatus Melainabacteria bacterium]|nr:hypothetical protein [Candidatus Melainabacteria bacterium]